MASRPKTKMSTADRAKQFAPFSALKGLDEALRQKERVFVEKPEFSDEAAEELSQKLAKISVGMRVNVVYYSDGECVSVDGLVTGIDKAFKRLTVVKMEIPMDDILDIKI